MSADALMIVIKVMCFWNQSAKFPLQTPRRRKRHPTRRGGKTKHNVTSGWWAGTERGNMDGVKRKVFLRRLWLKFAANPSPCPLNPPIRIKSYILHSRFRNGRGPVPLRTAELWERGYRGGSSKGGTGGKGGISPLWWRLRAWRDLLGRGTLFGVPTSTDYPQERHIWTGRPSQAVREIVHNVTYEMR